MSGFMTFITEHWYLLVIGLAELAVLAWILRMSSVSMAGVHGRKRKQNGESVYRKMIEGGTDEVQLTVRIADSVPVYVTSNTEQILGVSHSKLAGDITVLREAFDKVVFAKMAEAYEQWSGDEPLELDASSKSGRWFRISARRDEKNEYMLISLIDISSIKEEVFRMEDELRSAELRSESKSRFLSQMSHEIRTPMNGIIGTLSLMRGHVGGENDREVMNYLDRLDGLSGNLISLINDILDMSRIEAGKIEIAEEEFDILALADKISVMFKENIEAKGLQFNISVTDFDARYFIGDELRITQIISNFLSNALKFTEQGHISVTFKEMMREGDMVHMMLRVQDTGIGMDKEFLSHLFDPFVQENAGITAKYGGSGLGMTITDHLVKLMDGQLLVDTNPGEGTAFSVYLALKVAREGLEDINTQNVEAENTDKYTLQDVRILLAEDNDINAEIAIEVLSDMGAQVTRAVNGADCVEQYVNNEPGTYDVILMDVQMPVMDGREAAGRIRALSRPDSSLIPIFALSADAFAEDIRKSVKAGMDGHFSKPVDYDLIRIEVGRILAERAADISGIQ